VGLRDWNALPAAARRYLKFIEERAETRIDIVSTGPERTENVMLHDLFE